VWGAAQQRQVVMALRSTPEFNWQMEFWRPEIFHVLIFRGAWLYV
jgi:hypothetical protein